MKLARCEVGLALFAATCLAAAGLAYLGKTVQVRAPDTDTVFRGAVIGTAVLVAAGVAAIAGIIVASRYAEHRACADAADAVAAFHTRVVVAVYTSLRDHPERWEFNGYDVVQKPGVHTIVVMPQVYWPTDSGQLGIRLTAIDPANPDPYREWVCGSHRELTPRKIPVDWHDRYRLHELCIPIIARYKGGT